MINVPEVFGQNVFSDHVMRERLPKEIYKSLRRTIELGEPLMLDIANHVANAMKEWAIERGCTHYAHWFQPMTGATAEKHDSFIYPEKDGRVVMEFSGKSLVRGEPDASSFPSGGLRATFEARGYTAWDPTSYAFVKERTLYIPTAFCAYSGEALDKKTPLLRSMQAIDKQALRILRLFGDTTTNKVFPMSGAEQEYFLIDKAVYKKRPDLIYCGRTLFGARPLKGQEMEDHYFGVIKPRVMAFMQELDNELWKLGVPAKTRHNEAAPAQHELAPVFSVNNLSCDHNQLIMELIKSTADKHGLVALLHEKPFYGINGSGKHNNWSLSTNKGKNLFDSGDTPSQNARFLLMLTAMIKACDLYQDLLRVSVASCGNDHRLGANEAPPAIISVFLGDELTEIFDSLENGKTPSAREKTNFELGVATLPYFPKDTTDRNRTSPMAFTGNKFEFRMPGSNVSVAEANIVINTIFADVLQGFAQTLEGAKDFSSALNELIAKTYSQHKRIVFNGNNYGAQWHKEAKKRGLCNLATTADALPALIDQKNIDLFVRHNVYSKSEILSRYEILLENYAKCLHIEAATMLEMTRKYIVPAICEYQSILCNTLLSKKQAVPSASCALEEYAVSSIATLSQELLINLDELENKVQSAKSLSSPITSATAYCQHVLPAMQTLRAVVDALEVNVSKKLWPFPSYGDLLYSI